MNNLNQLLSMGESFVNDNKNDSPQNRFVQNRVLEALYSSENEEGLPEIMWVYWNDLGFVHRIYNILELKKTR